MEVPRRLALEVSGDLTAEAGAALLETVRRACIQPGCELTLDLSTVRSIDAHGLGAIVSGQQIAQATGGSLALERVHPEVARIFHLTGLSLVVPIVHS
ncbi:MAG: STAS domain-containing protein [Armatimonadota bacterium]